MGVVDDDAVTTAACDRVGGNSEKYCRLGESKRSYRLEPRYREDVQYVHPAVPLSVRL